MEFPFITLRNRTDAPDPAEAYGSERSTPKAGLCRVGDLDLGLLSPLAGVAPNFLREDLLRVQAVQDMDGDAVFDRLAATAGGRGPALYVHGYYIGFGKGCRRAALFQENAGLAGRFLWFTWPSNGVAAYYMHDEANLYWSVPDLADTIIALDGRFGSGAVDVIGHSLGARGVVLALYDAASRRPDLRLGNVVLMAPDMDLGIFARILPRIAAVARSITVYATTGDKPLALSAQLHGYPRLGEAGHDVSGLAGVEVIDLSDLPASEPTGHLYHIYSRAVGRDLSRLLNDGQGAGQREGLEPQGGNLWRLRRPARA
ncbi:alpha/beta hydrolase [Roseicyclus persicicus]|uniref:alpha/beta hydrolase n=1 Tax=Roseicyclus persicicus TaxID=2650661 RepID=UPI001EEFF614|nr:alpha/beta hydrolase [Roseibacterium persicicum]